MVTAAPFQSQETICPWDSASGCVTPVLSLAVCASDKRCCCELVAVLSPQSELAVECDPSRGHNRYCLVLEQDRVDDLASGTAHIERGKLRIGIATADG